MPMNGLTAGYIESTIGKSTCVLKPTTDAAAPSNLESLEAQLKSSLNALSQSSADNLL